MSGNKFSSINSLDHLAEENQILKDLLDPKRYVSDAVLWSFIEQQEPGFENYLLEKHNDKIMNDPLFKKLSESLSRKKKMDSFTPKHKQEADYVKKEAHTILGKLEKDEKRMEEIIKLKKDRTSMDTETDPKKDNTTQNRSKRT